MGKIAITRNASALLCGLVMCNMLVPGSLLYESCECHIFFMGYASTNILMNVVGWPGWGLHGCMVRIP